MVVVLQEIYRAAEIISHALKGRGRKLTFTAAKPGKVKSQYTEATLCEHPADTVAGDGFLAAGETVTINDEGQGITFLVMRWQVEARIQGQST